MKTLGIIAEYNPFHNGHLYHLQKAKKMTGAEFVIAIMSGNFLQRGEPAIFDKWTRALMALKSGVDLVIEIPFVFSSQDARAFANAGIKLLNSLGIVDFVTFGCEDGNISFLNEISELIAKEPLEFKKIIKEEVKKGNNFPTIREKALIQYYLENIDKLKLSSIEKLRKTLKQPNNILALEYLIALKNSKSNIEPFPIKRIGSNYSQKTLEGKYSSATAIRNKIFQSIRDNNHDILENLIDFIPSSSYEIISDTLEKGINPISISHFQQAILSNLRRMPTDDIKGIHGVQEGLENRIKKAAILSGNIEELIKKTKSKRYTHTRIQRILIHSLFNLKHQEISAFNKIGPIYCRVLGMTNNGKFLLKKIKKKSELPIIIKLKNTFKKNSNHTNIIEKNMLDYDIMSTNLYVLGYTKEPFAIGAQDYTKNVIIVDY